MSDEANGRRASAGCQARRYRTRWDRKPVLTERQWYVWTTMRSLVSGPDETIEMSVPELGRAIGYSPRRVNEALAVLRRLGRVRVVRPGGGARPNRYRVPARFSRQDWAAWDARPLPGDAAPYISCTGDATKPKSEGCANSPVTAPEVGVFSLEPKARVGNPAALNPHSTRTQPDRRVPFRVTEADLRDHEAVDGLHRRLVQGGWVPAGDWGRQSVHGLVRRAEHRAVNPLAFVAGVVRQGLLRVVSEREREAGREAIAQLDLPAPVLEREAGRGRRRQSGGKTIYVPDTVDGLIQRVTVRDIMERMAMTDDDKIPGSIGGVLKGMFGGRSRGAAEPGRAGAAAGTERADRPTGGWVGMGAPPMAPAGGRTGGVRGAPARPLPPAGPAAGLPPESADQPDHTVEGRHVYGLVVHDRRTIEAAAKAVGVTVELAREAGESYATLTGTLDRWKRATRQALHSPQDGPPPVSAFQRAREQRKLGLEAELFDGVYDPRKD